MSLHSIDVLEISGLARSFLIAYGIPGWKKRLSKLYRRFIKRGDLCFDIGSHLGNRIFVWIGLGAKIVAIEPQVTLFGILKRFYGHRKGVELIRSVVSSTVGEVEFLLNRRNPSLASMDKQWTEDRKSEKGWKGSRWDRATVFPSTTLDQLIRIYGKPNFCKIDVEGAEIEVLKGLSQPLPLISFEYLSSTPEKTIECLTRIELLGRYEYNWTFSEFPKLLLPRWVAAAEIGRIAESISGSSYSGDVYARLVKQS